MLYGVSVCFCLVRFTWLWASWGVPPVDSGLFVQLLPPVSPSVPVHDSPLWASQAPGPTSACGAAFAFSCFLWLFRRAPEGFFFLWTTTGSPVSCKELSSCGRFPTRGPSSECSLFTPVHHSNQMRPRRLRGAWFSRLLRHPARRWSGSTLSPGTHTGCPSVLLCLSVCNKPHPLSYY